MKEDSLENIRHGWLGLTLTERVLTYNDQRVRGLEIVEITPGGPADHGGLKLGDVLLFLKDKLITHQSLYQELSAPRKDEITLSYLPHRIVVGIDPSRAQGSNDHPSSSTALKRVTLQYQRINRVAIQIAQLLARLDHHTSSFTRIPPAKAMSLYPALFTAKRVFRCQGAGYALQSLIESPTREPHPDSLDLKTLSLKGLDVKGDARLPNIKRGDIIVLEGTFRTLIALYGGPSKCVKHHDRTVVRQSIKLGISQLVDEITLKYRRDEIGRQLGDRP